MASAFDFRENFFFSRESERESASPRAFLKREKRDRPGNREPPRLARRRVGKDDVRSPKKTKKYAPRRGGAREGRRVGDTIHGM